MFNQICISNDPFIKALISEDETANAIAALHLSFANTNGNMSMIPGVLQMSNTFLANTCFEETFAKILEVYNKDSKFSKYTITPIMLNANNIGSIDLVGRVIPVSVLLSMAVREYITGLSAEERAVTDRMVNTLIVAHDIDGNAYLADNGTNHIPYSPLTGSPKFLQKTIYDHALVQVRRMVAAVKKAYSGKDEALRPQATIEESIVSALTAMLQSYLSVASALQNNQIVSGITLRNFEFINLNDPESHPNIEAGFGSSNARIYFGYQQNLNAFEATAHHPLLRNRDFTPDLGGVLVPGTFMQQRGASSDD